MPSGPGTYGKKRGRPKSRKSENDKLKNVLIIPSSENKKNRDAFRKISSSFKASNGRKFKK